MIKTPFALDAASASAQPVVTLSWALFIGGGLILLLVLVMIAIAVCGPRRWRRVLAREKVIIGLGFAFPLVVLSGLLVLGLTMTAGLASSKPKPDALMITVQGEQWWWRINYDGFETANELVIPVGRPVRLNLVSDNVIHSFWVPQLGGKRDMIPGHSNYLNIQADKAGNFFGICSEYCGGPHALMQFRVIALPPEQYTQWEAAQRLPANAPSGNIATRGADNFLKLGCGVCHNIEGTLAQGTSGPDLTHLGSRNTIGAAILPMDEHNIAQWTRHADTIKPNNKMPPYSYLQTDEIDDIAYYLARLK